MGYNKFVINGATKFDLTADTVDAAHLSSGFTAHGADGEAITGVLLPQITLLGSKQAEDTVTATGAATLTTLELGSSAYTSTGIVYVKIRDKAGKRNGYFWGTDTFIFNRFPAQGATTTVSNGSNSAGGLTTTYRTESDGTFATYSTYTGYGIYGYSITSAGKLTIRHRYHATYSLTVDGTYLIEAYLVKGVFDSWYGA